LTVNTNIASIYINFSLYQFNIDMYNNVYQIIYALYLRVASNNYLILTKSKVYS